MIKTITFLVSLTYTTVFGQANNKQYDSVIQRVIERNVVNSECDSCSQTGASVIEVFKKDTTTIRLLYASDKRFDFTNDKNLIKRLNDKCNNYIKGSYKVIVPVYFSFEDQIPSEIKTVEKKMKKWQKKANIMKPVIIITYAVQRKVEQTVER